MWKKNYTREFSCDFETVVYDGQEETEVWCSGCAELFRNYKPLVWNNIDDFMEFFMEAKGNRVGWFHNEKFDGSFILIWLIEHGYKNAYDPVTMRYPPPYELQPGEFSCLVSAMGVFYSITVKTNYGKMVYFRDSLKLFPFSLAQVGKAFKTKHQKTTMEYKGRRYAGWDITPEEREYFENDLYVLKEALEAFRGKGYEKNTIGSCCLEEFRGIIGEYGYTINFPDLSKTDLPNGMTEDEFVRLAYRGGWCYVVSEKANKLYEKGGIVVDVNSLYPSVMLSPNKYPVGKGCYFNTLDKWCRVLKNHYHLKYDNDHCGTFYYIRFLCRFRIKDDYLPFIQIKNDLRYMSNEMLKTTAVIDDNGNEIDERVCLTMSCVDFDRFVEFYHIYDFKFLDGIEYFAESGIFDRYIEKYRQIKENSEGAERTEAKLFLNNLYGQLATSPDSSFKVPYLENRTLKWHTIPANDKKTVHVAAGAAVTAYARDFTIRAAQANYHGVDSPGFIYADTDSLHLDIEPSDLVGVELDDKAFKHWALEKTWERAKFIRQKCYIEETDGICEVTCAGMPKRCKESFVTDILEGRSDIDDFKYGLEVYGKLQFKQIPGGAVLKEVPFRLNEGVRL